MPRLPPHPSLITQWVVSLHTLGLVSPSSSSSPCAPMRVGSGQSLGQPAGEGHLILSTVGVLTESKAAFLSSRGRGAMLPKPSQNGSPVVDMSFPPQPFQGLSPKRRGQGLPTMSSVGLPGAGHVFPLGTSLQAFEGQASVPSERDPLLDGGSLLFCPGLQQWAGSGLVYTGRKWG